MSYTYLLERGEESSAESFSAIPASVLSNGTNTRDSASSRDSETDHCQGFQYGTTSPHLTGSRGKIGCRLSVVDFHARTSHAPEKVQGSLVHAVACGSTWRELLMKYDHVSSLLKTHHCLWEKALSPFSVTLPQWGMMRDGEFWEQTIAGVFTFARGAGYWPTPLKNEGPGGQQMKLTDAIAVKEGFKPRYYKLDGMEGRKVFTGKVNPEFAEWLMGWPMGWTNVSQGLETGRFRQWLRLHSAFFHGG